MSEDAFEAEEQATDAPPPRRRRRWPVLGALALLVVLALALGWCAREKIANRIIAGQLEDLGLPATYEIEKIGTSRQILKNIVIGDPAHPDMTVERAEVVIEPTLGMPTLGRVTLVRPRLYGSYRQARLSLGSLDKLLYAKREGPSGLPDLDLELIDGRARLDSEFGPVGIKAEGRGNLRGGFAGILAAVAPKLAMGGCKAQQVSAYGKLSVSAARPRFEGPVRLAALDCAGGGPNLRKANLQLAVTAAEKFDRFDGNYAVDSGAIGWQGSRLGAASGKGDFSLAQGDLTASYKLQGKGLDAAGARVSQLALEGQLRSHDRMASFSAEGMLGGKGVSPGKALDGALASLESSGQGTLVAPVAKQLRGSLAREAPGSTFSASYQLRQSGQLTNLVIPGALWRGGSGAHLLTLSRVQATLGARGGPKLAGNLRTDGAGLPRIEGRFERRGASGGVAQLSLAEYRAGDTSIALPRLQLVQLPNGAIGFAGQALVSGALPGGRVDGLALPVEGNWSQQSGLAALRKCTPVSFTRFKVANLALSGQSLTICPGRDGAILKSDGRGTRLSAGTAGLALSGTLGTTAIRLKSGAVGLAWPGALAARGIDVSLGPVAEPTTLKIAQLDAMLGKVIDGSFAGTELKLNAVPLDVYDAAGKWHFANGDLAISGASLWVKDRERDARFYPLMARDAALQLHSTTFTAQALLREPQSDREVVVTRIEHDLDTMQGHADLDVPGILFDDKLQPDTLTYFTKGVVALAQGTVSGKGRIDWDRQGVTSTGEFSTQQFDFAALFGPVKGVRGTVRFTDLLGLVTAPNQHLAVASINPGIVVEDGDVSFQLQPGRILEVNGAEWPFIDGRLVLLPTSMALGTADVRRFTLKVDGANAAKFVQQLDLSNISARGTFDGTLPLIFDQDGGRIEGGLLVSRPPGGNLSYVGELTYKDLSTMGNFAFQALRSLDFKRMEIGLAGNIDGEIVTALRIDGVSQGQGAKRNFITSRFAGLPIRFNINIRAPFYQLVGTFKSYYDPSYLRDPRDLWELGADGRKKAPTAPSPTPAAPATPPPVPPAVQKPQDIQHSDSRNRP
ncbi:YdbH domain-containing protein [Novosphingobium sp.]|uniref:YdbH domain-containing protein n=1 Tax=Novosphingobium sp. TaxID=1874826 RepID=UPI0025DAE1FD|nr:YdbH domain-containing protein [Novosphingobium sp.]